MAELLAENESPLIYGVEFQARALCSHASAANESSTPKFLIGTQSLKQENQLHVVEYLEETHSLSKVILKHPHGEIWDISSSSKWPNLVITSYASQSPLHEAKINHHNTLWKFPFDMSNNLVDGDNVICPDPLEKVCDFDPPNEGGDQEQHSQSIRTSLWHPDDGNQIITLHGTKLLLWDVESHKCLATVPIDLSVIGNSLNRSSKISAVKWSPHSSCSLVGFASGQHLAARDLRVKSTSSASSLAWNIPMAHTQLIRDLDFNPNAQYYIGSCGDDCETRFWDIRNPSSPAVTLLNHSHWVWTLRYNPFHDQLVLTSSSDFRVNLLRIATLASQPYGHLLDEDEEIQTKPKPIKDEVIAVFEEHEDSVYAAEWAKNDPWIFASLSFDGRLVINRVPKQEKFNILF